MASASSPDEAEYIYYSQSGVVRSVPIPLDLEDVRQVVSEYKDYLERIENDFFQAIFARSQSPARASSLSRKLLRDAGAIAEPLEFPPSKRTHRRGIPLLQRRNKD
jgi:hypothetical protein